MYDIIIYHGGCPDGIGGAWCYWRKDRDNNKFYPGQYGKPPPDVTNKKVLFIDFTYPKDVMQLIINSASYVRVLDHHKSALPLRSIKSPKFSLLLDLTRSGAQIAWDELYNNLPRPWFINDIADRDLWKWSIPDSKKTTRGMFGLNYYQSFDKFNKLQSIPRDHFINIGEILLQEDDKACNMICNRATICILRSLTTPELSWKVNLVECSDRSKRSEVGNRLSSDEKVDFAAMYTYNIKDDEWWISLRASDSSTIDLSEVVKHFENGGGHPKAAGFTIYGKNKQSLRTLFTPV